MSQQELNTGSLHAFRVLKELSTLRQYEGMCDGAVQLVDGTVRVSKAVLAAGCPYFRVMFEFEEGGQQGQHRTALPCLDITSALFNIILDFIYTGKVTLDNDNIEDILKASDLLLMTDLKELCIQYLLGKIDVENCLGILQFAQQFSCPRLEHIAQEFVCKKFRHRQIVRTEEFFSLSEERLKKLLSLDALDVTSEVDILVSLVVWLNENLSSSPDVESLVTCCLRESSDLNYDPKFQRALQELRASNPPWDCPGAARVLEALGRTRRIRSIRERGTRPVLFYGNTEGQVCLLDALSSAKHSGDQVKLPPLCVPRHSPALVAEGGYLFALGGLSANYELTRDVQRYDPKSNSWTLMAPMPYACCAPQVVAHAGKLYVTGGYMFSGLQSGVEPAGFARRKPVDQEQDDVVEYSPLDRAVPVEICDNGSFQQFDIYTNKWRTLPPLCNPRFGAAMAVADGKIYYIGGIPKEVPEPNIVRAIYYTGGIPKEVPEPSVVRAMDSVEVFSIKEEVWLVGPPLRERRQHAAAVSRGGNIYVVGGTRRLECPSALNQQKLTETEVLLSSCPSQWMTLSNLMVPDKVRLKTVAAADREHIVVVGKHHPRTKAMTCMLLDRDYWQELPQAYEYIPGFQVIPSFALLTLPSAAVQDLFTNDSEQTGGKWQLDV